MESLLFLSPLLLIVGGAVALALPHPIKQVWLLAVIALSAWGCWQIDIGTHWVINFMGAELILNRATDITKPFALVFHIAAALNVIYGISYRAGISTAAAAIYGGAAIAALYAGDFLTLFIFWEATAFASVILVLAGNNNASFRAAMRYLAVQLLSGVLLLAGVALLYSEGGTLTIQALSLETMAGVTLFLAFGIKAAFPLLNGWMHDAYPQASAMGSVVLSAFTTKLAIYMLALCFAGTSILIWIGVVMALTPLFFIAIEKDLRRIITYILNNQLGLIIIGIGIGSQIAMNGAIAHAFASVIYQGLLFMTAGAILLRTGTTNIDALGGLAKQMPFTLLFMFIGGLSLTAFPFFAGYTTKSLTLEAIIQTENIGVGIAVIIASIFLIYATLKIIAYIFFGENKGVRVQEAPMSMLVAMMVASLLSLFIGIAPEGLYTLLPYRVDYEINYFSIRTLGDFASAAIGIIVFVFLWRRNWLPPHLETHRFSSDWFYTNTAPRVLSYMITPLVHLWRRIIIVGRDSVLRFVALVEDLHTRSNISSGAVETGIAAGVILFIFLTVLALRFFL